MVPAMDGFRYHFGITVMVTTWFINKFIYKDLKKNIYVCNDPNFQEAMLVLRKYHTFNKLHVDLSRINMKQQFK